MNAKPILLSAAVAALVCASAHAFTLKLWRGETAAAIVPDNCELGDAPTGIKMKVGTMKKVQYAPKPGSLQRLECFDRVKWRECGDGPRVIEVSVLLDVKPGVYRCGMMEIVVEDQVLPPPREWKYYLDLWQHPWAIARYHGLKPFSREHYAAMRPVYELLATAGQKTLTVTLLDQPWGHQCYDAYHSMFDDGDFKLFDEYVAFGRSCGLGPDISCYSLCPWTLGKKVDDAELERRWGAFLDRFAAHLKEKGWYKDTIMSMDERAPEDVRKVVEFVHRHAPGMRIAMAGDRKPSEFKGIDIDIYSQCYGHVDEAFVAEAAERRKKGFITTYYVCCGPAKPNTFMDSDPQEAFDLGYLPAKKGLDGFLRWAWNSWPKNPKADASFGNWRAGDTFLCYPNGEPSWRFLQLRNGIIAAEKTRILGSK